jgi:putative membrane protein
MRLAAGILLCVIAIGPAAAHGIAPVHPETLWRSWSFDALVVVPILIVLWLYGSGLRRLWKRAGRGHGVAYSAALSFALGMVMLFIALVSPLDALGATLLSAHMAHQGLMVAAVPPLLLFGKPGVVITWALNAGWRRALLGSAIWRRAVRFGNALSRPLAATVLHGLALWGWHAPAAFNAAVASEGVHALEHACFFVTALLLWRAILDARSSRRAGAALGAAFATLMHSGLLGALITMAPYPLYLWYGSRAPLWGFTALEDQQLAGLLMWVPMGFIYLSACLVLARRLMVVPEALLSEAACVKLASANPLREAPSRPL